MEWLKKLFSALAALFHKAPPALENQGLVSPAQPEPVIEQKPADVTQPSDTSPSVTSPEPVQEDDLYKMACVLLVAEARKWIGITEKGGDNKGPEVEAFQKAVDGKAQGEAWCLAFVQFCVKKVDAHMMAHFASWKPSWLAQTEHVMTLWTKTPEAARLRETPHPGSLFLWQHWKDGKATVNGHVGIVVENTGDGNVKTVEGNTGPAIEVEREGDGVYEKVRRIASSSRVMRPRGFLTAWDRKQEKIV